MNRLPEVHTADELDALVADPAAVDAILARLSSVLGIREPLVRPIRGSAIVGVTQTEVVKLMAPLDRALAQSERACLQALDGRLPIPTPRVLQTGELDGWPWIRMSRLAGQELAETWPALTPADHLSLATQLGEALAALHQLEAPAAVERLDWSAWRTERLDSLLERQRARKCPEALLEPLHAFVAGTDLQEGRRAWLHTEVMREHLLVEQTSSGWRLSGLFDFEPSWVGPEHYEYASVGLFVSAGQPGILREILRSAGTEASPRRLFAMAMLHRYANLGWYHRRLGGPLDLEALAERWFAS